MKVLSPKSGFLVWRSSKGTRNSQGIWLWRPGGFDYRTSRRLGGKETPLLEGAKKKNRQDAPRPRRKEQWPYRRLNHTYLLVLEGLLWRHGSALAHRRDGSTGSISPGRCPLALLEVTINSITQPVDGGVWSRPVKKLTGRECSPTYPQIIRLNFFWAWPYPPEQEPVFPIASSSHKHYPP